MKVLVIGSRVPFPLHDGGAIATFNMLGGMAESGIEVHFIALNTKKHYLNHQKANEVFYFLKSIHLFDIDTSVNIFNACYHLFTSDSYNIERFYNPQFAQQIADLINNEEFDVVHFEGLYVAKYIQIVRENTNVPCLLRQHNVEYQIWERLSSETTSVFKSWYLKHLAKRLKSFELKYLTYFDSVVTISTADENKLAPFCTGYLLTIPPGINMLNSDENISESQWLYHIGSMEWQPNREAMQWFVEKIMPLVVDKNKEVKFFMAGKQMPTYYFNYQTEQIQIIGEVPDLQYFIKDKGILVVPLRSGSGIRIKTIEAMAAGKAVVTTTIGLQGLDLVNGEHCLVADTEQQFCDAILKLQTNSEYKKQLAENARNYVNKNYNNSHISSRWQEHYRDLITNVKEH